MSWAFGELRDKRFDEELGASLAWEALYAAINKTIARTQVKAALLHVEHPAWAVESTCPELMKIIGAAYGWTLAF